MAAGGASSPPFLWWVMAPRGPLVQSPLPVLCCNKQTKIFPRKMKMRELQRIATNKQHCPCPTIWCNKQANKHTKQLPECVEPLYYRARMAKSKCNNVQRSRKAKCRILQKLQNFPSSLMTSLTSVKWNSNEFVSSERISTSAGSYIRLAGSHSCQRDLTSFKYLRNHANGKIKCLLNWARHLCEVELQIICQFTANLRIRGLRQSHSCQRKLLAKSNLMIH